MGCLSHRLPRSGAWPRQIRPLEGEAGTRRGEARREETGRDGTRLSETRPDRAEQAGNEQSREPADGDGALVAR